MCCAEIYPQQKGFGLLRVIDRISAKHKYIEHIRRKIINHIKNHLHNDLADIRPDFMYTK